MNCKYCQHQLTQIYKEERDDKKYLYILDLMCEICQTHFEYFISDLEEPVLHHECFYHLEAHRRQFEVHMIHDKNKTVIKRLMENPKYGEPMEPMYIKEVVFTLNQIPKWDPFNVKDKLELLLPFI